MNNLIIMGAGTIGGYVCENVIPGLSENYDGIYFYDNNIAKQGTFFGGIKVLSKVELEEITEKENCSIIISTDFWKEFVKDCEILGIEEKIVAVYTKMSCMGNRYLISGYGQEGEDNYLKERMGNIEEGFYVDIGAHHPYRFSNTYWAYCRGWKGINIEPNVDVLELFKKVRSRDINLNCGIALDDGELDYYKFEEGALNTFCKEEFEGLRIPKEIVKVPVYRLESIFDLYDVGHINFMNIDVEGFELGKR